MVIYYNGTFYRAGERTDTVTITAVTNNGFTVKQEYNYSGWTFTYFACT
jgi:hypothetical protein